MTLLPEDRTALRRAARKMADAESFRAEAIRQAVRNGASAREVGAEVGLSHTWVRKLAAQATEDDGATP